MDIIDISLSSQQDKGPLQMVSGEQVEKWQAIESVARRLIHNQRLGMSESVLSVLLHDLERALTEPAKQSQASSD